MYIICYIIHNYKKLYTHIYIYNWLYILLIYQVIPHAADLYNKSSLGENQPLMGAPVIARLSKIWGQFPWWESKQTPFDAILISVPTFMLSFQSTHLLCQYWEDTLRSQFRDGMTCCIRCSAVWESRLGGKGTPLWKSSWHQKYDTTLYILPNINRSYMINVDDIVESQ